MQVHTQFVQCGERRVFVRHAGQGPAVVLLHQSPQNSRSMLALMARLAPQHAVFAPDSPGFGFSDPLALAQPTIPDLAQAVLRLLDALGLERVLLYGVHTGAVVAARLALERSDRVAALVCDGLALFNADERRGLLDGYLPPFEPAWDGSHLLWLWARLREQNFFFPWQMKSAAHRLPFAMPAPDKLHADVLDVLDAGDGYRAGYRAPFLYEQGAATAAALRVPARLFYRDSDVLAPHITRLVGLPAQAQAATVSVDDLHPRTQAFFAAHAQAATSVVASTVVAQAASRSRRVVPTPQGDIALRLHAGAPRELEVVLPEIGTAAAFVQPGVGTCSRAVIDLPGHGASSGWQDTGLSADSVAAAIAQACEVTNPEAERIYILAYGASATFGAALALQLGARCAGMTVSDALPALSPPDAARLLAGLPSTTPDAQGSQLLAAWNWARQRALFLPWAASDVAAVAHSAAPSPWRLHADVVEMLRAGVLLPALWRAALSSTSLHSTPDHAA